jgi:hypothetical protein
LEVEEGCRLPLAPAKRAVVATDPVVAEDIAARLGPGAEVGTWRKRLVVDYALWSARRGRQHPTEDGRRAGGERGSRASGRARLVGAGRIRKGGKLKPRPGCVVRLGRIAKACHRARQARAVEAKHRRRLLASGISPAGIYGAEHAPWNEGEVRYLAGEAVRVAGLSVGGVPFHVLRLLLAAAASPEWKV